MNTYSKYTANVFLAKCEEEYKKGDTIIVTTKRGKENESIVHNFIYEKDGYYYYSTTRSDGLNIQERARRKAEKHAEWASRSKEKANEYSRRSVDMMSVIPMGQPIHSVADRNYRDKAWAKMGKSVELSNNSESHREKAEYWSNREYEINLSIPESLEYYTQRLEEAEKYHSAMKNGEIKREHSFSLTYAKKEVNNLTKKVELAQKLWG